MGSQRLRPMPRLMLLSFTEPTDMPVSHTPVMPDMPTELTHMPMVLTTGRDLLMLSQRLMLTMDTTDMPPYAYGYRSYGYPAYGYYGKRSADAEPEAEADAFYGVYGYSAYRPYAYSAYRPYAYTTRWGYGKRSADAEAEADPALVYTSAVPAVHSVVSSPLVSALTPAATLKTVHTPVTYTHAVAAPAVTYAGVHAVHTPVVNTVGSTVYYGKREAEADPALLYTNAVPAVHSVVGTHAVVGSPLVHHTYAVPTVAKTVVPAVTVAKAADHGVVGTYAGLVHSSHAGICLNNVGVQVPC